MIFEVSGLTKRFGDIKVLRGVDLYTSGGRALGLLGRNGAGKTTTIRIVMGVFPADSGSVMIDGAPLDRGRVKIGYLPEEHGLYPKLPVTQQLVYLANLRGMTTRDARRSIAGWLDRLGMTEYAGKKLDTLSKGNQQKIQLAACLVTNPDLIILDEPFSGLDPVNAALLKDVVKEQISQGKIVLFSSHQMNYVEEFCDSIAILHQGKIVLSGGINEIKRSYERNKILIKADREAEIAAFLKSSLDKIVASVENRKDGLLVTLSSPKEKRQLMRALTAGEFEIDSMGVFEPGLGDIFVDCTGDHPAKLEKEAAQ